MRFLLHHAILDAAQQAPHQEAVRYNGSSLSYADLATRAATLAHTLIDNGAKKGDRIGIYMNKGLESAVAIYGTLLAGAAYVPLDPFAPHERLRYVIQDCGIHTLISMEHKRTDLQQIATEPLCLDTVVGLMPDFDLPLRSIPWAEVAQMPTTIPATVNTTHNTNEQDLAYILYTSGSTGTPKGIMHTHRSGLSFAEWAAATYGLQCRDRVSNHAPLHFDLSTFDYFATAIAGATVVIIPEAVTKFPASQVKMIAEEQISVWYSVPFALIQMVQRGGLHAHKLGSLRWVLFAGEPFPTKHLRELMTQLPHPRYSNLYGPTETNVCTYYHVPALNASSDEPIPIGQPCVNTDAIVLDAEDQPVASGEVGELLIRGPLLMQGYWGRPDLTERALFYADSIPHQKAVYYRTGDLVQLQADGDYKYLGRKDRQIKTRGYRVELDEIEVALLAHDLVQEAAVYPVSDGQGSNLIAAAVIVEQNRAVTSGDLVNSLAERLPSYAIPHEIHIVNDFPRTSTGKINRRAMETQAAFA